MSPLSIRTLLTVSILLPILIVYTLSIMVETRTNRKEAVRSTELLLQELIAKRAAQVDGHFSAISQIPKTLSDVLSITQIQNEEDFKDILEKILTASPNLLRLSVAFEPNEYREGLERFAPSVSRNTSGAIYHDGIFYNDLAHWDNNYDYMQRDWYRLTKETGQPAWSEPYIGYTIRIPMCTYSVPFFRDDRFVGVIMIDIALEDIQKTVTQTVPEGAKYRLLSAQGAFIAAAEPDLVMAETIFSVAEKHQHAQLSEIGHNIIRGDRGILLYNGLRNDQRAWLAYAPLPIAGWSLTVSISESQVLAPVYARLHRSVFRLFIALAVTSAVIIIISWRLTAPIQRLATFAGKLAAGDLDAHVGNVRLAREIDQLADTFDKMVVDLKANIEQRIKVESERQVVEGELKAARRIQASLLPHIFPPFPERNEFDLHATNEPVAFIAGDFFDFFFIEKDKLAFVIADVSGHGIPAALFMAVCRTAIRTFAVAGQAPHEIIDRVNRALSADNDDMMFVTLFYGHYDVKTGEVTYVNAGHDPPYVVRKNGHLDALSATGPLAAPFADASFEERTVRLEPDDVLVTFTDGVTEAHTCQNNFYGVERLERLIQEVHGDPVKEICDKIRRDVEAFSGVEPQDDITLLVLRRNDRT